MSAECSVDAELFESLQQAVDFVADRGGGVVYTRLATTPFAASLRRPDTVRLEPVRSSQRQPRKFRFIDAEALRGS